MKPFGRHAPQGFALPVTLFALVVIGAMVTGGFYLSAQERQVSASSDLGLQAFTVAEYGLQEVLGAWKNKDVIQAATDGLARTGEARPHGGSNLLGTYTVGIEPLGSRLYMIRVGGTVTRGPAASTREVAGIIRTTSAELPFKTTISTLGSLNVSGKSGIYGDDLCGAGSVPAVSTPNTSTVTKEGQNAEVGHIEPEPTMDQDTLSKFNDVNLQDLIDSATRIYPAGAIEKPLPSTTTDDHGNTVCATAVQQNWGDLDPSKPCGDHYPIVYGEGDFTLDGAGGGSVGQGVLVVEGNLRLAGNFKYQGVVIVKGNLEYEGTGAHVEGAMIVMGTTNTASGNSTASYNSCAVANAFNGGLRPRPLQSRAWVDLDAQLPPPAP